MYKWRYLWCAVAIIIVISPFFMGSPINNFPHVDTYINQELNDEEIVSLNVTDVTSAINSKIDSQVNISTTHLPQPSHISRQASTSAASLPQTPVTDNYIYFNNGPMNPTLIICNQPFLINHESLPTTLDLSIYYNKTLSDFDPTLLSIKLDDQVLEINSINFNPITQLFDISVNLPIEEIGKYMLTAFYESQESSNFKGVNICQYNGNFTFAHLTDIHFDPPKIGFEYQFNKTIELIQDINPDFIISTGDISSYSYQRFYMILKAYNFDIPIFYVPGNHEKESLNTLKYSTLYLGDKKSIIGNETPTSFSYGNYHFIGIDSSILPFASQGNISDQQYSWFENELRSNQNKNLITFCHHPLYYNQKPNMGWVNASIAGNIMNISSAYGVKANFAGHFHRSNVSTQNGVTYYSTVSAHNDTHWVSPTPFPPSGFRLIRVENESIVSTAIVETFSYYTGEFVTNMTTLQSYK